MVISIGATSYTKFGESTFLQTGDEVFVCVYDKNENSYEDIQTKVEEGKTNIDKCSLLHQIVV
jgi:hypothetical protein